MFFNRLMKIKYVILFIKDINILNITLCDVDLTGHPRLKVNIPKE